MLRKLVATVSMAAVGFGGIAAAPALAQGASYRYSESYQGDDGSYYQRETYEDRRESRDGYYRDRDGYSDEARYRDEPATIYDRDDYGRGRYDRRAEGHRPPARYARCTSGTTGTILGAVVGGLLGREVGRGGHWNQPSTTGLILGAGGGALAGRAIERNNCR